MATQAILLLALVAGAGLAFFTGWRGLTAYAVAQAPSLRRFGHGFLLLALAQLCAFTLELMVASAPTALERGQADHFDALFWAHYVSLLAGLLLVFSSFGRKPFRWTPAVAPLLLVAGPLLQLLTILVLFFVVLHSGLNHIARKGRGSRLVSLGFFFVMVCHIANLTDYGPLQPRLWWAELIGVLGFAILFFSIAKPRKVRDA